jgi:hypothetical protein
MARPRRFHSAPPLPVQDAKGFLAMVGGEVIQSVQFPL